MYNAWYFKAAEYSSIAALSSRGELGHYGQTKPDIFLSQPTMKSTIFFLKIILLEQYKSVFTLIFPVCSHTVYSDKNSLFSITVKCAF